MKDSESLLLLLLLLAWETAQHVDHPLLHEGRGMHGESCMHNGRTSTLGSKNCDPDQPPACKRYRVQRIRPGLVSGRSISDCSQGDRIPLEKKPPPIHKSANMAHVAD